MDWVRRFILFHGKRHPQDMGAAEVRAFLESLVLERHVAIATQKEALNALGFLYEQFLRQKLGSLGEFVRASRPARLPVVLSQEEVPAVLAGLRGEYRLVAGLLYGAGWRLLEALRLRVKDGDFARRQSVVREGKGEQDRVTLRRRV